MHLHEAQRSTAPDGRQQALPHRRLQAHQAQRRVCACARHPSTAATAASPYYVPCADKHPSAQMRQTSWHIRFVIA